MPTDLALDQATGDLHIEPNNDIAVISGQALVDQRIRVRLKVPQGDWLVNLGLNEGEFGMGSRLHEMARLTVDRAFSEIPLVVKEALAPMTDIRVQDVVCSLPENTPTQVDFTVYYTVLDDEEGESESDVLTFNDSVQLQGVTV